MNVTFNQLDKITDTHYLRELKLDVLKDVQRALSVLGYPAGEIDGLIGPRTRNAWAEFKSDYQSTGPEKLIDPQSAEVLKKAALAALDMSQCQFDSAETTQKAIQLYCEKMGLKQKAQIAYVLATVEWETNRQFKPVKEAYWLSEEWRQEHLKYSPHYGRGYVQITWKHNYEHYGKLLDLDLVNEPDKALDPQVSCFILVHGFLTGAFTGRKLEDYINSIKVDFRSARRCINGKDKAHEIAELAGKYMDQLN